jgi:predicted O-methyltransferase YrrM
MTLEEKEAIVNGIGAQTGPGELAEMLALMKSMDTHVFVEIGVSEGRSFCEWAYALGGGGLLIGIDAFDLLKWDTSKASCEVKMIIGDTLHRETEDKLIGALGGEEIDFLRIDAGHSYAAVKSDYDIYAKYVRPGGVIAFHDNVSSAEVGRFVRDLSAVYNMKYLPTVGTQDTAYYIK